MTTQKIKEALEEAIHVIEVLKPDNYGMGTIVRCRDALAALSLPQEVVATVSAPDHEDERDGVRFSLKDWARLNALPAGTVLYASPLTQAAQPDHIEDVRDMVSKAMRRAFSMGQTYWQQADHEFVSQNKKADETQSKFEQLVDETRDAIRALKRQAPEPVAAEQYADKLVREYVAALLANDKDAAGKATCAMADYVMRPVNRAAIDMRNYALDARADLEKQNEKLKNQLRRWKDAQGVKNDRYKT